METESETLSKQLANVREELKQNPCLNGNFGKIFSPANFEELQEKGNSGVVSALKITPGETYLFQNNRGNDNDGYVNASLVRKEIYNPIAEKGKSKPQHFR